MVEHEESFEVTDASGSLRLAFIYFDDGDAVRRTMQGRLTRDEARRIAANIAKLPDLLRGQHPDAQKGPDPP